MSKGKVAPLKVGHKFEFAGRWWTVETEPGPGKDGKGWVCIVRSSCGEHVHLMTDRSWSTIKELGNKRA